MRSHNSRSANPVVVGADSCVSEPRSASIHFLNSPTRPQQHRNVVRRARMLPTSRNETAEILTDIDGLPVLVRFLVKDAPAEMQSCSSSKDGSIHPLLSSTLEKMVDRLRGSSVRSEKPSKQPLVIVELTSSGDSLLRQRSRTNERVLRVGSLELDLMDRTAKRGERPIDLRPREFLLLKYMMQRSDELLTRATLFRDVWHYKFVPESNLVDVHMGLLRRKVDRPDEAPMIRNVRGAGFVLSSTPLTRSSTTDVRACGR
jgi:DNA-binding response OmpR family regulator